MNQFRHGDRRGRVGVAGAGYVGAAVADAFSAVADVVVRDPRHQRSVCADELAASDVVFVCVPTPAGLHGAADTSAVQDVLDELAAARTGAVVVVKSTVPPGTTERLAAAHPTLALAHAPEFLRERHARSDFEAPHRLVVGWPASSRGTARELVRAMYACRFPGVQVIETSATEAELVKYASNALFAVKVSLANELAELASALGVPWTNVQAVLTTDPRIGADHLAVPGPDGAVGFGGRCLPKDVAALLHLAGEVGVRLPVLECAQATNRVRREVSGHEVVSPGGSRLAGGEAHQRTTAAGDSPSAVARPRNS